VKKIVSALLLAVALAGAQGLALGGGEVEWIRDHAAGMKKAREERRPVLLYVGRPGSEADRNLARDVFADAAFAAATKQVVAIRIERGLTGEKKPGDDYPARGDAADIVLLDSEGALLVHVVDPTGRTLSPTTWTAIVKDVAARRSGATTLRGKLERRDVEGGVWVLVSGGTTYDLHGDLSGVRAGDDVVLEGRVRPDVACMHQVGTVFEVVAARPISRLQAGAASTA